uniref:Putative Rossmann fold-containing protein n=1 Tax=uncultured marine group II/III euryarchaeote AD1000_105_G07 TaxID=1457714 RepID=A0A075FIT0_9EURY|nr:putative Rossmann fold-containing protein [uncultured marine group II/III euryarchaeote AD1000_105_G07]
MGGAGCGPGFLKSESCAHPVGSDMVTAVNQTLEPLSPSLVDIQSEVREAFGWTLKADFESAQALVEAATELVASGVLENGVERLRELFSPGRDYERDRSHGGDRDNRDHREHRDERPIAVLGAAVAVEDILALPKDCILVAADGSVGVIPELPEAAREAAWENLVLVVSDADGGVALQEAIDRKIPFALHAHGDNTDEWALLLTKLGKNCELLLLTHQCPNQIVGMHNPGGFTDGDRAACLVSAFGVDSSQISLIGFRSDRIGRWTGATDPILKMQKLQWMDEVLTRLTREGRR